MTMEWGDLGNKSSKSTKYKQTNITSGNEVFYYLLSRVTVDFEEYWYDYTRQQVKRHNNAM